MAASTPTTPGDAQAVNAGARPKRRRARRINGINDVGILPAAPSLPPPLPLTPEEIAAKEAILRRLEKLRFQAQQDRLEEAVALARQAARREGPLVEHFINLAVQFAPLLSKSRQPRPALRVIDGGAI